MESQAWVKVALDILECSQKDLALKLGVSPSQITKWKSDEYMSFEMEQKFRRITGITSYYPSFVLASGSVESAEKWAAAIESLASLAYDSCETGYSTWPLQDEIPLLSLNTFQVLESMGVAIPSSLPDEINAIIDEDCDDDEFEKALALYYFRIILSIFRSLNDVFGFYAAYISELIEETESDLFEVGANVEACLMSLAATKIVVSNDEAPKFRDFRYNVLRDYEEWLQKIKAHTIAAGRPLRAEILDLIDGKHDELGVDAEKESLGLNNSRLHPDIYMNELLVGMRAIHQVLPAIVEKLGISEDELSFDPSSLVRN
ncbi:helix-turn-helix transcriptional regulator [Novosphingopyxis sp. YJ-S2-01]|uniref:helix-turn-helix transcriptional regulator n=1 Tax=Novosphingopyxis sp. YJ-S2-01 TaxID=2794021 RepID=UPI0018DEBFCF|nr:helix-turn-helix transcriptional regulator [Novosphingopyxis sp. YJ-S2-01]MBH9536450.1 helix-turn-helix transcriptional regulator [Novosphingopyxis sp. YJ-S2-01]